MTPSRETAIGQRCYPGILQNKTHYNNDCEEAGLQIGAWLENEKKYMI
jgi:hypothetical protein